MFRQGKEAMIERVTPMIHVPDVAATVEWYRNIGFTVDATYGHDGEGMSFAVLSFGSTQVMFNQGGRPNKRERREVDLYVYANNIDDIYERLKDRTDVIDGPHDTFYGAREFIIRDCNRFWITFGQTSSFGMLMNAVQERDYEAVRAALEVATKSGGLTSQRLTNALVAATTSDNNDQIAELLKQAGAVMPPELDEERLQRHVGEYKSDNGMEVEILLEGGKLFAVPAGDSRINLVAEDETTFRPTYLEGISITFSVDDGKTTGFVFQQEEHTIELKRV
ncbi:MAG TPA: VOC family protein [Pyrinomonadaceae bacterium]|nr:VOC family protein [Pyrinomonadaceae bacterium]